MLQIALNALILMVAIKVSNQDEEIGFGSAILTSIAVSVMFFAAVYGLSSLMGGAGLLVAAVMAVPLAGAIIWIIHGLTLGRAMLAGLIFTIGAVIVQVCFSWLFAR